MRFTEISNKKIGAKLTERSNKNIVIKHFKINLFNIKFSETNKVDLIAL